MTSLAGVPDGGDVALRQHLLTQPLAVVIKTKIAIVRKSDLLTKAVQFIVSPSFWSVRSRAF